MLRRVATATTGLIYLQIIVGATMRHSDAGLAIPDFPLVFGGLVPPQWTAAIAIHYAHRLGALLVSTAIAATVGHVWYHHADRRELRRGKRARSPRSHAFHSLVRDSGRKARRDHTAHVSSRTDLATSLVLTRGRPGPSTIHPRDLNRATTDTSNLASPGRTREKPRPNRRVTGL